MAKSLKKFLKSFTLIELIIVIAIIAVLGATAFLVLSQWMSKSRDSRKIADLGTIDTAINISFTSNDKLPTPDNMTNIMFGGSKVWELGYFGDGVVSQIGGALTKTPFDPTTKTWYRYAQWDNKKYQLGTIVENEQFSDYFSRVYANEYFTRLQGSYNQSIIVTKIGTDDVIIPAPSLIVDAITGTSQTLDEEHFWTNKGTYNLGQEQTNKLKVETLFSGNITELQDPNKYEEFKTNFTNTYSGTVFLKDFNTDLNEDKIEEIVSAELKKVSSQNVSVQYLSCDGYNHGTKMNYYKQETVGYGESCDSIKSQFECKNGVWEGETNKAEYTKTSCNAQLPAQCDGNDHGTVKDFFSADSVVFGQSCETTKKTFTCENGAWKDGINNADTTTYQYTSCVVGNPVDCNDSNIVKKSVTNLDITFDITATLHGQSFEKAKTITENNGSYEYTLVGDCSNGTYQEVTLSDPVNKGCNTGYNQEGNSCVPKNCDASTQTVNGHTYNVGVINHGLENTVTTSPIAITNGTITYTQTFQCNLGEISASGSETTNTPTCSSGYSSSGSSCVPNNCEASTQTVNSHIYNVGAINHGLSSIITTSPISISNGTITYKQSFICTAGEVSASGSEITNTPTCNSGYSISGSSCVPSNCIGTIKSINGHTYNVGAINHGSNSQEVSNGVTINDGMIYYKQTFSCNLGVVSASGQESINNVSCDSGYTAYYDGCEKSSLMNSIIGYWSFDESSGNYAKDKINNTNHLDLTNSNQNPGSWVTGKRSSSAYRFNGVGWLRTGGLSFNAPIKTISYWYKIPSTANYAGTVISFEHSSNTNKEVNLGQNVNYYGLSTCSTYTSPHLINYGAPINDTNRHFISFSLTSNAIICVDGTCKNTGVDATNLRINPNIITLNGGIGCGFSQFTDGIIIDELRFFSDTLTTSQMQQMYTDSQ